MSNTPVTRVVLHYSATYPDQDIGAAEIRQMHKARGWNDIGYHYVIRRDGRIEPGRAETVVGAHVAGHNTGSIGICCVGGIDRATGPNVGVDNRTDAQRKATISLVRDLLARHPRAQVLGHRDLTATQCPGFDVRTWWAQVNREPEPPRAVQPKPIPVADAAPQSPARPSFWSWLASLLKGR